MAERLHSGASCCSNQVSAEYSNFFPNQEMPVISLQCVLPFTGPQASRVGGYTLDMQLWCSQVWNGRVVRTLQNAFVEMISFDPVGQLAQLLLYPFYG